MDIDDSALWIQQTDDGSVVGIVIDGFTMAFADNWAYYEPKKSWPADILKAADEAVHSMKMHGFIAGDAVASQ